MRTGVTCVEPILDFIHESTLNWGYCCFAIHVSVNCFPFEGIRESALTLFGYLGLTNVFRHFRGFLVFSFRDKIGVSNFLKNCLVVIDKCVFKVKSRHEFFPDNLDNLENEKVKIWVKFTRVLFIYWTVKGLCMLGSAVGELIGMDKIRTEQHLEMNQIVRLRCSLR
ncbi:hypothetical protein POM88_009724 [Heracleum sosnowskyi]|uniref:DUF4283 domain-containing protein n=1 Tax=Heracleum sosnowskyi TaxID=360622 RepID=A0AAD8J9X6_9APIA|nr:hypothetical protein POM88_009724 [Heracleum sosnowskyi]